MAGQVDVELVRRMTHVIAKIHTGADLAETFQAVADGVVDGLGFAAAAVNYIDSDGDLTVMAVTGSEEARSTLLGQRVPRRVLDRVLLSSSPWGGLVFVDHREQGMDGSGTWTRPAPAGGSGDGWHAEDGLLAPLRTPTGALVGVLSVDLEAGAPVPSLLVSELLESFAASAAVAIDRAQLLEQVTVEHRRLQASERAFQFAFSFSAGPMATLSLAPGQLGLIQQANWAFRRTLGIDETEEMTGRPWLDLFDEGDRLEVLGVLQHLAGGTRLIDSVERQLVRPDGTRLWANLTASVIDASPDEPAFLLVHLHDVTDRRHREQSLLRESGEDPLTGLANRRALLGHLDAALNDYRQGGAGGVVLYGDLNRFKQVNDTHGHDAGDTVLRRTAQRLLMFVRSTDLVARISGDEFVIVATGLTTRRGRELAGRIKAGLAATHHEFGDPLTISVGVAGFDMGATSSDVLRHADIDMYIDKRRSRP